MHAARNNDRRCTNIVTHVYDFAKLARTRKTATCYSSLSASRSLLLDFVHRDSGGDFLPPQNVRIKTPSRLRQKISARRISFEQDRDCCKKGYTNVSTFTIAVVIRIRSLTTAEQFVSNEDVRNCTSE